MDLDQKIAGVEIIVGRPFQNRRLVTESLNHGGLPIDFNGSSERFSRNDRLAILGDSLLDTILLTKWYNGRNSHGRLLARVEWSAIIRNDLVTNVRLASRGRELGLDACVICDPGTPTVSTDMLATTFEAVIAAVYLDSGADLDTVETVMERLGFFNHPLLLVTFYNPLTPCSPNKQMSTNVRCIDSG